MPVSAAMPDDVIVLHDALQKIRETYGTPAKRISPPSREGTGLTLYLKNCGTALRFLQVHLEQCYPGEPITLDGDPRLKERDGKPTTQTTSALILHGHDIPVEPNESPYITMSRRMAEAYSAAVLQRSDRTGVADLTTQWSAERDWSSASYWYEYIAIHGGELKLEGLKQDSLQGDRIVADIYAEHFGVRTTFTPEGALIIKRDLPKHRQVILDFTATPDLFPAIALTCEKLGMELQATGTERLRYKESDRIEAVQKHEVRNDHRMAMALMCADYSVSIEEQACIAKSYPEYAEILRTISRRSRRSADGQPTVNAEKVPPSISHITPIRGVNDDNLGKKHALSKLIHAASGEYVWLHDDDVVMPPILQSEGRSCSVSGLTTQWSYSPQGGRMADLIILPLIMESLSDKPSILERLQIAEYAAIQEVTMMTAKQGKAVMCSGANLIVRREAWLACESDLHPEIPSGDDMFLLEAMKRRGYKVEVIDTPKYTAVVRPQTSWRAFWRQRMRWAGKAPHYTDPDILRYGRIVLIANVLQFLCPLVILIKFPFEYSLIRRRQTIDSPDPKSSVSNLWITLLLEILYPYYLLISLIGGIMRRNEW